MPLFDTVPWNSNHFVFLPQAYLENNLPSPSTSYAVSSSAFGGRVYPTFGLDSGSVYCPSCPYVSPTTYCQNWAAARPHAQMLSVWRADTMDTDPTTGNNEWDELKSACAIQ